MNRIKKTRPHYGGLVREKKNEEESFTFTYNTVSIAINSHKTN
jgi:hypothetical protein